MASGISLTNTALPISDQLLGFSLKHFFIMFQHLQLIERAQSLGIQVTDISAIMDTNFAILEKDNLQVLIREGVPMSWINVRSQFYCDNKQLTKMAYEDLALPHPKSITFKTANEDGLADFLQPGMTYVCKPLDGTNGVGVRTGIRSLEDVKAYYNTHQDLATIFMLEEQVEGDDLRIHVLGGKIVAACIREPAFLVGNGQDSLAILIEKRRAQMKTQNPNNFLEMDQATRELLLQQHIQLSDIPAANRKIRLKKVSNMAQGGMATDVTDAIHPMYHEWVGKLVDYLKTNYFGLDLITKNYEADPQKNTKILEINARADWLHHTFSEHRTHDMASMILEELFG